MTDGGNEREELAKRYAAMGDEELMELAEERGNLTEVAAKLLSAEVARRKLALPAELVPQEMTSRKLATVRQFRDLTEAMIAKSALDSAGIECFLANENTVRMDWVWSNLLGGVRLQVAQEDVQAAEDVLSQPIPETIAVEGLEDYQQPHCPKCGSLEISYESVDQKIGVASAFLIGVPIALSKDAWKCHDCGAEWRDDSDAGAE